MHIFKLRFQSRVLVVMYFFAFSPTLASKHYHVHGLIDGVLGPVGMSHLMGQDDISCSRKSLNQERHPVDLHMCTSLIIASVPRK